MTFVIELELCLFHQFLVLVLYLLDLVRVLLFQNLDLVLDLLVTFELVVDLFLMVLLEFCYLLVVSFLFKLESL